MRHSVAVLVLSPRADQVAVTLPKKAAERGAEHVRVPPQGHLPDDRSVGAVAYELLQELLVSPPKRSALQYLGTGRGDAHRGEDVVRYGKWIHWMGVCLEPSKSRKVFRRDSTQFLKPHFSTGSQLLVMDTYAMSQRKYMLTLQALLAFSKFGVEGKLLKQAREGLAA